MNDIAEKIINLLKSKADYKNVSLKSISDDMILLYLDTFMIQVFIQDNQIIATGARKLLDKMYNDMIFHNNYYDKSYELEHNNNMYDFYSPMYSDCDSGCDSSTCNTSSIGYGGFNSHKVNTNFNEYSESNCNIKNECCDNTIYYPARKKPMYLRCSIATYKGLILDDLKSINIIIELEKDLNNL